MVIPHKESESSTTGNATMISQVTHTPAAHGSASNCFGILNPEQGLKVNKYGVAMDIGTAEFELEYW
jgi:uncharacterized 2Fe-2S/4Fe-4S cluster protein (DUF4445 family)